MAKKIKEEVSDKELKQLIDQNETQKEALKKILQGMSKEEKSKR
ncbi:hypothetical protein [Carboxylicivirga litoralis]|nr:hypothetical protein [Carboxylicivirga sp. A043]